LAFGLVLVSRAATVYSGENVLGDRSGPLFARINRRGHLKRISATGVAAERKQQKVLNQ
jgi:hypothetical protein